MPLIPEESAKSRRVQGDYLRHRLENAIVGLMKLEVRLPTTGRHIRYLQVLQDWYARPVPLDETDGAKMQIYAEARRFAWETFLITAALERYGNAQDSPFTPERFRLMFRDDIDENRSKDAQFELYVGAELVLTGLSVTHGEPDLRFAYGQETVGLAAKRITSLQDRTLEDRIREAERQIKRCGSTPNILFRSTLGSSSQALSSL
jgi:hypothetical protein